MAGNRFEALNRHELPLQAIRERDGASRAIVPIHPQIIGLLPHVRVNRDLLRGSYPVVSDWYNQDMEHHIEVIRADEGTAGLSAISGYERFGPDWSLGATRGKFGFLDLNLRHRGRVSSIGYKGVTATFMNIASPDGEIITPELLDPNAAELIEKNNNGPEFIFFTEPKLREYSVEAKTDDASLHGKGMSRIKGLGLTSDLLVGSRGIPVGLALRAYGVFYHNRLLEARAKTFH